ncbi:MAG: hypothetical protein ACE5D6_05925 [Candidatus Zixiibacteriota bacterium]
MNKTSCPKCKSNVIENAKFCPGCGFKLKTNIKSEQTKSTASNSSRDLLIVISVVIVITAGYFIFNDPKQTPQQTVENISSHPEIEGMDAMMGALANMPDDYNSLVRMGNETMDQGNYPMGAECYRRALEIKEDSPDIRTDYGACLHGMGLAERAIEEFMKVIEKYPEHSIANYNLGIVYYTIHQHDSARTYWNKYLAVASDGEMAESIRKLLKEIGG